MRAFLRSIVLLSGLGGAAEAQIFQSPAPEGRASDLWVFGFSGFGGIPVGEFRKHENGGGGLQAVVGFQPFRRQPLVVRAQAGVLIYGRVNRDVEREYCDLLGCFTETTFYDSRDHLMLTYQAGPELMATGGRWRPFAYALAGGTTFRSQARLGQPSFSGAPPSQTLFTATNFSTSYGLGLRMMGETSGRPGAFEISVNLTRNAKARYLTERGVSRRSDGTWVVTPQSGAANVLGIHIGMWVGPNVGWNR